jgi:hypothetical protein
MPSLPHWWSCQVLPCTSNVWPSTVIVPLAATSVSVQVDVGEPDKKGKRMVQLMPRTKGVGCAFGISTEDWAHAAPLLERIQAAATEKGGGRPS